MLISAYSVHLQKGCMKGHTVVDECWATPQPNHGAGSVRSQRLREQRGDNAPGADRESTATSMSGLTKITGVSGRGATNFVAGQVRNTWRRSPGIGSSSSDLFDHAARRCKVTGDIAGSLGSTGGATSGDTRQRWLRGDPSENLPCLPNWGRLRCDDRCRRVH